MFRQKFLPESMYKIDSNISRENLFVGQTVTGKVILVRSQSETLLIDLGNGLEGLMSVQDATIYPVYKANGYYSPSIYSLVGKVIRARITNIEGEIYLSRKEHMLEALETLKYRDKFHNASITAFSKLSAFIDVGAGIGGMIRPQNFCNYVL